MNFQNWDRQWKWTETNRIAGTSFGAEGTDIEGCVNTRTWHRCTWFGGLNVASLTRNPANLPVFQWETGSSDHHLLYPFGLVSPEA